MTECVTALTNPAVHPYERASQT